MTDWRELRSWTSPILMPRLTRPDAWLLCAVGALVALGIVMVLNVSYFHAQELYGDPYVFFRKHVIAVSLGALLLAAASGLRPDFLDRWASALFVATLVALVIVLIPGIGAERSGAQRWICAGGFCVQPSEWAKVTVVLYLAHLISRRREQMSSFRSGVLPTLIVAGLCIALIALQPDFGTATILGMVLLLMLYAGGARPAHLAALAVACLPLVGFAILQAEYRLRRLLAFMDPWRYSQDSGFQLVQSLIAFGSGGLAGVGLGQSRQKMFFLPEAHTDFIFALIGEELGLCGAVAVLGLFALIAMRGFRIASRHPDPFASLLAYGLTLVVVVGAVVNIGVVLGVLPTKGLVLPLLSYGGSALIGTMICVGLLAALSRMTG
jgi:cell division protein FtsW